MDQYFGLLLFAWIVIAPTVGLFVMSRTDRRDSHPARAPAGEGRVHSEFGERVAR